MTSVAHQKVPIHLRAELDVFLFEVEMIYISHHELCSSLTIIYRIILKRGGGEKF